MGSYAVLAVIVVVTLVAVFLLRGMGGAKEGFGGKEPSPKAKRVTAQAAAFFETHSASGRVPRRHTSMVRGPRSVAATVTGQARARVQGIRHTLVQPCCRRANSS